jgi:hypothetical protein
LAKLFTIRGDKLRQEGRISTQIFINRGDKLQHHFEQKWLRYSGRGQTFAKNSNKGYKFHQGDKLQQNKGDKLWQEGLTLAQMSMMEETKVSRVTNFGRNQIKNG